MASSSPGDSWIPFYHHIPTGTTASSMTRGEDSHVSAVTETTASLGSLPSSIGPINPNTEAYGGDRTPGSSRNQIQYLQQQQQQQGDGRQRVSRPIRRRSRASRRTPTTLLNTDPTNFRAMVQQFTGGYTSTTSPFSMPVGLGPHYPNPPAAATPNFINFGVGAGVGVGVGQQSLSTTTTATTVTTTERVTLPSEAAAYHQYLQRQFHHHHQQQQQHQQQRQYQYQPEGGGAANDPFLMHRIGNSRFHTESSEPFSR